VPDRVHLLRSHLREVSVTELTSAVMVMTGLWLLMFSGDAADCLLAWRQAWRWRRGAA
jgi:hypothetical protein